MYLQGHLQNIEIKSKIRFPIVSSATCRSNLSTLNIS